MSIEDQRLQRRWYVLHTKSRHEAVVHDLLCRKSMDAFLPKIKVRSSRRDRKLMIHIPLFPGYVFVKTDLHPHTHLDIVKTAGAVRLIGTKTGPVPVAEETVESLKDHGGRGSADHDRAPLQQGDRVMVVNGPFAGVTGTFVRYRGPGPRGGQHRGAGAVRRCGRSGGGHRDSAAHPCITA